MDVWADPTWPTPACAFCYLRFLSIFRWLSNLFREVECSARLFLASDPNGTSSERHLSIVLQIPGAPTQRAVGQQLSRKIACMAVFKQQSQRKRPVVRFNPATLLTCPPYQPQSSFQVGVRKNRNTLHGRAISQQSQIQTPFNIAKKRS